MPERYFEINLFDEAETERFGAALALAIKPGDLIYVSGDLGAGKTTLARALIRTLAGDPVLDVPSPTFSLVQLYKTTPPVTHLDLYRLSSAMEINELGLDEALESGVALVEWPERGEGAIPEPSLVVELLAHGDGRLARISGETEKIERFQRSLSIGRFLDGSGWAGAARAYLLGDASTRAYESISSVDGRKAILMNAPRRPDGPPIRDGKPYSQIAHLAESTTPFVAIAKALKINGFAAPDIYAFDLEAGLVLLEDLGADTLLDGAGEPVQERYRDAARLLAKLHGVAWPRDLSLITKIEHKIPDYDRSAMMIEVDLLIDWYMPFATGRPLEADDRMAFSDAWERIFEKLRNTEKSLVLRDYHSPNIIWRGDREGHDRLGLIDFQDALIGPSAYDMASLAMDARVTISEQLEGLIKEAYVEARQQTSPFDREAFEAAYAIMAAQRNSKILGIFVRLNQRDGKPGYLKHLPRIRDYISRTLRHPALEPLVPIYRRAGLVPGEGS